MEGSAVIAVDVIVVGIVVAIAVIVGRVNYAFFLTRELRESAPLALRHSFHCYHRRGRYASSTAPPSLNLHVQKDIFRVLP